MKEIIIPFSGGIESTLMALQSLDEIQDMPVEERGLVVLSNMSSYNFQNKYTENAAAIQIFRILTSWYPALYRNRHMAFQVDVNDLWTHNDPQYVVHWEGYGGMQCPYLVNAALAGMNTYFSDIEVRIGYLGTGQNIHVSNRVTNAIIAMSRLINVKSARRYCANVTVTYPYGTLTKKDTLNQLFSLLEEKEQKGFDTTPLLYAITYCEHRYQTEDCYNTFNKVIYDVAREHPDDDMIDDSLIFSKFRICPSCHLMLTTMLEMYSDMSDTQKRYLMTIMSCGNNEIIALLQHILQGDINIPPLQPKP